MLSLNACLVNNAEDINENLIYSEDSFQEYLSIKILQKATWNSFNAMSWSVKRINCLS